MPQLLHIAASPRGQRSLSGRLARELIAAMATAAPALRVVERDLAAAPVPHPDAAFAAASLMPEAARGDAERKTLTFSETLIAELKAADILVLSTPMHNFTVPSVLKAWLDHVVRPGRTFRASAGGKVGLLYDRPVFAIVACGGRFGDEAGEPGAQCDFLGAYLRYVLASIGLCRVEILRLQELNRGPEKVDRGFAQARAWIAQQVGQFQAAGGS